MSKNTIIILLVLSNIYFAVKWFASKWMLNGLMFYIIEKEYTPPTKEKLMECVRKCVKSEFKEWLS